MRTTVVLFFLYNVHTSRFEGTITVTTHDFEKSMNDGRVKKLPPIESLSVKDSVFSDFSSELTNKFKLSINGDVVPMSIVGYEVYLVGTTEFYFESDEIELNSTLTCSFDLLMNSYQEQQNKMTFILGSKKSTYTFLYDRKSNIINLESENDD
jgi:hypothetical protein